MTDTLYFRGVTFNKKLQRWTAFINLNYTCFYLGYYGDFGNAVKARQAAEAFVNGKDPFEMKKAMNKIKRENKIKGVALVNYLQECLVQQ